MNSIKNIFIFCMFYCIGIYFIAFTSQPTRNLNTVLENDYNVYAIEIPDNLDFSGEVYATS